MRVTLDTNIFLSGMFWNGDSRKILRMIENEEIELILSKEILDEFKNVLNYKDIKEKISEKSLDAMYSIDMLISWSIIVVPSQKLSVVKVDSDDNKIVECALEGKVNYIITNDFHLLKLKRYGDISIISPKEFLSRFKP